MPFDNILLCCIMRNELYFGGSMKKILFLSIMFLSLSMHAMHRTAREKARQARLEARDRARKARTNKGAITNHGSAITLSDSTMDADLKKARELSYKDEFHKAGLDNIIHIQLLPHCVAVQLEAAGQSGASCGYHALKNTILVLNQLVHNTGSLKAKMLDAEMIHNLIGNGKELFGLWRYEVINNVKPKDFSATGDNIGGRSILHLIEQEKKAGFLALPKSADQISVFETTKQIGEKDFDDITPAILDRFYRSVGEFAHGFVVNTGGETVDASGKIKFADAHWISVVLYRTSSNAIIWIVTDTGKGSCLASPSVNKLVNLFK